MGNDSGSICNELEYLANKPNTNFLLISEIIEHLKTYGFGILMVLFSLPVCAPIPVPPGLTTILSVPLLFFPLQIILGRNSPWLPEILLNKKIRINDFRKAINFINPYLRKIEKYVKPRLSFTYNKTGKIIMGFIWFIFACSISVPLPMISILPGAGILLSAFGLIKRDGYIILAGYFIGLVGFCIIFTVVYMFINS